MTIWFPGSLRISRLQMWTHGVTLRMGRMKGLLKHLLCLNRNCTPDVFDFYIETPVKHPKSSAVANQTRTKSVSVSDPLLREVRPARPTTSKLSQIAIETRTAWEAHVKSCLAALLRHTIT